jgi:hypothetical protein
MSPCNRAKDGSASWLRKASAGTDRGRTSDPDKASIVIVLKRLERTPDSIRGIEQFERLEHFSSVGDLELWNGCSMR